MNKYKIKIYKKVQSIIMIYFCISKNTIHTVQKIKKGMKKIKNKRNYLKESGITLTALTITIVVLLILAMVGVNTLFGSGGVIEKAQDVQNVMNMAKGNDEEEIKKLNNWIGNHVNGTTSESTAGEDDISTTPKISELIEKVVDKNTKAEDTYGNKITIPKGFKVLAHSKNTTTGDVTYTYSGDNIPAVQDGIVIENGTDGNQFVWVPVGTIKNKKNTTNTITLGRYSDFTMTNKTVASGQPVQVASEENYAQAVTVNNCYQELSTSRKGSIKTGSTENATARNLAEFISTTLKNGGYYIARFEASGDTSKIASKYNQTVLTEITQPDAAIAARKMYGEVIENDELVYASDLVNSYAWDTAIIFIQTYSTGEDASTYASQNKSTSFTTTGGNSDKYCNIWDMSGNAFEWTTEFSTFSGNGYFCPCVTRGGYGGGDSFTYSRDYFSTPDNYDVFSFRTLLYVK